MIGHFLKTSYNVERKKQAATGRDLQTEEGEMRESEGAG